MIVWLCLCVARAFPAQGGALLNMAQLPRWIVSDSCDSQAMYSAFLAFFHSCGGRDVRANLRHLAFIVHRGPDPGYECASGGSVSLALCRQRDCGRCPERRGGYAFRWYDQRWYSKYLRLKRPGSWTLRSDERLLTCSLAAFFLYSDDPRDGLLQAVPDDEPLCRCLCGCWKPLRYLPPAEVDRDRCYECQGQKCLCSCIGSV